MASEDEQDGPLFRVRTLTITQIYNRSTKSWQDSQVLPETTYTLVKTGDVIAVMTGQPALDITSLPYRTILQILKEEGKQL